jgi:hypothetical protein
MSDYGYAEHQRGTKWWGKDFLVTFGWAGNPGCLPKVTRRKGGTLSSHNHENGYAHKNYSIKDNSHHTIKHRAANPAE